MTREQQTDSIPSRPEEHDLGVVLVHHPNGTPKPIIEYLLHIVPSEGMIDSFNLRPQAARPGVASPRT